AGGHWGVDERRSLPTRTITDRSVSVDHAASWPPLVAAAVGLAAILGAGVQHSAEYHAAQEVASDDPRLSPLVASSWRVAARFPYRQHQRSTFGQEAAPVD